MAHNKSAATRSPAGRTKRVKRTRVPAKKVPPKKSTLEHAPRLEVRAGRRRVGRKPFPIVGIGASAGGLEAFKQLLEHLPVNTGMAFVFVQHLDPRHESILSELLARTTAMPVNEGVDGGVVEPDHVYVIPANTEMAISNGALNLQPRHETGHHRPIDYFLCSLARDQSNRAIGVILSGTASDGTLGLQEIKAEGGITFAQDAKSAKYDGMPRSAVASGCVDFILSPVEIARELARIARHPYVVPSQIRSAEPKTKGEDALNIIFDLLHKVQGVDFARYKSTTLHRRLSRRMVLHKMESLEDYAGYLRDDRAELQTLYEDLLISVTSFFRNPEAFEVLKNKVFPHILNRKSVEDVVRAWVLGSSTGEEVYSIAISFLEFSEELPTHASLQIFGTDLNEASIQHARSGIYPKSIAQDVSPERLRHFFVEVEGGYQVGKRVRDMCVFARQNVLADPPFSRMDFVSCRNVLIYLEPAVQAKLIPIFHYALNPKGILFLGSSETIGKFSDLFATEDKKHRFYSKKAVSTPARFDLTRIDSWVQKQELGAMTVKVDGKSLELGAQQEADRIVLTRFAPAGVVINDDLEILQFRGSIGPYVEPAPGKASLNLLKMTREGLLPALRAALNKTKKENRIAKTEGVAIEHDAKFRKVNLEVIPLKGTGSGERFFLVLFEEAAPRAGREPGKRRGTQVKAGASRRQADDENTQLRRELAATREYLQSVIEQHEAANEELQAAGEETQSSNEELQSLNEELETAKEELESGNEELTTVNEELHNRNQELNQLNCDLINLLSSVNLSILMLDDDLRIRRFTQMAEKVLNLTSTDIGRRIGDINLNLDLPDLQKLILEVLVTQSGRDLEIRNNQGHWYSMSLRPYRTLQNEIEGAVIVLVDIDDLKRSQSEIKQSRDYAEAIVETVREPLVILDAALRVNTANRSFYELFRLSPAETENKFIYDLDDREWDIPALRTLLEGVLTRNASFDGFEVEHDFKHIGRKIMLLNARRLSHESGASQLILLAIGDVSASRQAERERIELVRAQVARSQAEAASLAKDEFFATVSHELRTPLNAILGWARLLGAGKLDHQTSVTAIETIQRCAKVQAGIIDDLLDTSRIIAGKLRLQIRPVNLALVVETAVDSLRSAAGAKSIELAMTLETDLGSVGGDPNRLQQVMQNLLSNAIKFTPKGGRVEARLERVGSRVRIIVSDNGCGISREFLPYVFDRFRQADTSYGKTYGGMGLGLAIVRHIVEAHAGTIQADSAGEGQGAIFTVTLPFTKTPEAVSEVQPGGPAVIGEVHAGILSLEGLRVLVVEDEKDAREMLSVVLTHSGADVTVCASAAEAIEALQCSKPDVLVSDIGLPGEDGYKLIRKVRALSASAGSGEVPAVAVTGYTSDEDRNRALSAGYNVFIPKPVELTELTEAVATLARLPRNK